MEISNFHAKFIIMTFSLFLVILNCLFSHNYLVNLTLTNYNVYFK